MWLIASDLHLTDAERDKHRLGIFRFLAEQGKRYGVTEILLLGDITDRKDNHPGRLVNSVVTEILDLVKVAPVHILQGNHDYANIDGATFRWFQLLDDLGVKVRYYDEPTVVPLESRLDVRDCLFFPFQRDKTKFTEIAAQYSDWDFCAVFFHQTFTGAETSTGLLLPGVPVSAVDRWTQKGVRMFSGDIHVPQKVGGVEYIGSPYQINFGDKFEGRVVLYDPHTSTKRDLKYPCTRKHTIELTSPDELSTHQIARGDQVKIRLYLTASQQAEWAERSREIEQAVRNIGAELFGVEVRLKEEDTPQASGEESTFSASDYQGVFDSYCKSASVPDEYVEVGKGFINPNRV